MLARATARVGLQVSGSKTSSCFLQRNAHWWSPATDHLNAAEASSPFAPDEKRHMKLAEYMIRRVGRPTSALTKWSLLELERQTKGGDKEPIETLEPDSPDLSWERDLALARSKPRIAGVIFSTVLFGIAAYSAAAVYTVKQAHDLVAEVEKEVRSEMHKREELRSAAAPTYSNTSPHLTVIDLWLPYHYFRDAMYRHERWAARLAAWTGLKFVGKPCAKGEASDIAYEGYVNKDAVRHPGLLFLWGIGLFAIAVLVPKGRMQQQMQKLSKNHRWHTLSTHYICSGKVTTLLTSSLAPPRGSYPLAILFFFPEMYLLLQPFATTRSHGHTFRQVIIESGDGNAMVAENRRDRETLQASNGAHTVGFLATVAVASNAVAHLVHAAAWHLALRRSGPAAARYIASVGSSSSLIFLSAYFAMLFTSDLFDKETQYPHMETVPPGWLAAMSLLLPSYILLNRALPGMFLARYRMASVATVVATSLGVLYNRYGIQIWDNSKILAYRALYGHEDEGEAIPFPLVAVLERVDGLLKEERALLREHYSEEGPDHDGRLAELDATYGSHRYRASPAFASRHDPLRHCKAL